LAGVIADGAANAGTIESSNGSARAAPAPRRKVRLCKCFLVIIMVAAPSSALL
jgi:hypothetical protein